jgi:hypothetical protein
MLLLSLLRVTGRPSGYKQHRGALVAFGSNPEVAGFVRRIPAVHRLTCLWNCGCYGAEFMPVAPAFG